MVTETLQQGSAIKQSKLINQWVHRFARSKLAETELKSRGKMTSWFRISVLSINFISMLRYYIMIIIIKMSSLDE